MLSTCDPPGPSWEAAWFGVIRQKARHRQQEAPPGRSRVGPLVQAQSRKSSARGGLRAKQLGGYRQFSGSHLISKRLEVAQIGNYLFTEESNGSHQLRFWQIREIELPHKCIEETFSSGVSKLASHCLRRADKHEVVVKNVLRIKQVSRKRGCAYLSTGLEEINLRGKTRLKGRCRSLAAAKPSYARLARPSAFSTASLSVSST